MSLCLCHCQIWQKFMHVQKTSVIGCCRYHVLFLSCASSTPAFCHQTHAPPTVHPQNGTHCCIQTSHWGKVIRDTWRRLFAKKGERLVDSIVPIRLDDGKCHRNPPGHTHTHTPQLLGLNCCVPFLLCAWRTGLGAEFYWMSLHSDEI